MKKENLFVILTGVVIGIAALVLTALGGQHGLLHRVL